MPELPEVETVRRGLLPVMEGTRILQADVNRPDLRWPLPKLMAERVSGTRVTSLRRRSKYLLADLSSGETLLVHLGMSGRILISGEAPGAFRNRHAMHDRHDHVVFHMEGGARVTFNDPRRFGAMDLVATDSVERHQRLAGIGPEPLGNAFDEVYLTSTLKGRRTTIKSALLDQRVVAGLGNIYVCEALHRAGVAPARRVSRLAAKRIASLVPNVRDVLSEAIAAGGSSLRDYRQADGELGYFQHAFRVYGRAGEPCTKPGCGGRIVRTVQSGRSSFHCPKCQR
ncbi:MAG: bifunctional DNA-formamidopyrimidine glycosylase/DNA-(apurinic or apyrimidinic site) lyase [Boseongicola sp. SB0676_bin_33]|nr:bifunctional DNA-formamidopyrimidine glycosylase/DNA-(apurinic or apyrimidinic site) lyase [Boseongicola sp. SB0676_bin_33]MYK30143.1 bifunctional DNA-formamidopyrimidine glycosylase/DNA-(apurinic or apyrimidinic site) lyase [Boseongicola sp. SB0670_bin_30]